MNSAEARSNGVNEFTMCFVGKEEQALPETMSTASLTGSKWLTQWEKTNASWKAVPWDLGKPGSSTNTLGTIDSGFLNI